MWIYVKIPDFSLTLLKTLTSRWILDFSRLLQPCDFVRSGETDLGRLMLVVAVISVDAYPFFGFLAPDLSP